MRAVLFCFMLLFCGLSFAESGRVIIFEKKADDETQSLSEKPHDTTSDNIRRIISPPITPVDMDSLIQQAMEGKRIYWRYGVYEDEFSDTTLKVASLRSRDGNATLLISFDIQDKKHQKPTVAMSFSKDIDSIWNMHTPICFTDCTVDLNVDGEKYPGIKVLSTPEGVLISQYSKTTLNRIQDGSVIKVRVPIMSGNYVYVFTAEEPFDIDLLKSQ